MKQLNRKNGFTLVELLVVISIIAILTVITLGGFSESQKRSRDSARKANLKSLSDAVGLYYADTGSFPASITFGGELKSADGVIIYMKKIPKETTMLGIGYTTSSTRRSFRLITNLENDSDKDCVCYLTGAGTPTCSGLGYSISSGCGYIVTSSNIGATSSISSWP